jgi:hypothetical protein
MGDKDLELLGKLNSMDLTSNDLNPATRALLGDYSQREPTPVSMRTPRFRDALLKEAQNVIALQNVETPLIGGTNLPLNNPDFSGLTPKTKIPSTPNVLAQTLNNLNNNIVFYEFFFLQLKFFFVSPQAVKLHLEETLIL